MHYFDHTSIVSLAINYVGNKSDNDLLIQSKKIVSLSETIKTYLKEYFLSQFKTVEYFQLFHLLQKVIHLFFLNYHLITRNI